MRKVSSGVAGVGLAAVLSSCSVADVLTSDEILEEFDEIVRVDGEGPERRITYNATATLSRSYMRMPALAPVRWPLAWAFGRRAPQRLENPAAHVRALLRELPNETRGGWLRAPDLQTCAAACARFAWLAELDENAMTRIRCIDGLSQIARQLGRRPFDGDFAALTVPMSPADGAQARARVDEVRAAGGAVDVAEAGAAIEALTSQPLATYEERILLVDDLHVWLAATQTNDLRAAVSAGLLRAIDHCIRGVLIRSVTGRARELAEVRLCGMEQIRRLGGSRTVPLLLAVMAASPSERANGATAFDTDVLVMLRLIHYCGQLSKTESETVVRLPGRQDWEATSPAEFLARTILEERDYYSQLRTAAIVALTWCLGRPTIEPDAGWVREWIDERGA